MRLAGRCYDASGAVRGLDAWRCASVVICGARLEARRADFSATKRELLSQVPCACVAGVCAAPVVEIGHARSVRRAPARIDRARELLASWPTIDRCSGTRPMLHGWEAESVDDLLEGARARRRSAAHAAGLTKPAVVYAGGRSPGRAYVRLGAHHGCR